MVVYLLLLPQREDRAPVRFSKEPTKGSEPQTEGPLEALANLPAVVRWGCLGSRRHILGRRPGGCQLPRGGERVGWPQSPQAGAPPTAGLGRPARMLLSTTTLLGPHLPECQDEQGQQQEAPQRAAHDDPDGDLRVFLLGDLKRDL